MAGVEALSRLAPGTIKFEFRGGRSELTAAEVAGLLSGCSPPALSLGLLVYAAAESERPAYISKALFSLSSDPEIHRWQVRKDTANYVGLIRRMIDLATFEVTRSRICPICNGVAAVMIHERVHECGHCDGKGQVSLTDDYRAEHLEVTPSQYLRIKSKLWHIELRVRDWIAEVHQALDRDN